MQTTASEASNNIQDRCRKSIKLMIYNLNCNDIESNQLLLISALIYTTAILVRGIN